MDAANELDEVVQGRSKTSESAKRLAELLRDSFSNGKHSSQVTVKSGTIAVFWNALESIQPSGKPRDISDMISAAMSYAKTLSPGKWSGDLKTVEEAKTFCIALAKAAAGYRESVFVPQSENGWR